MDFSGTATIKAFDGKVFSLDKLCVFAKSEFLEVALSFVSAGSGNARGEIPNGLLCARAFRRFLQKD